MAFALVLASPSAWSKPQLKTTPASSADAGPTSTAVSDASDWTDFRPDAGIKPPIQFDGGPNDADVIKNWELLQNLELLRDMEMYAPAKPKADSEGGSDE